MFGQLNARRMDDGARESYAEPIGLKKPIRTTSSWLSDIEKIQSSNLDEPAKHEAVTGPDQILFNEIRAALFAAIDVPSLSRMSQTQAQTEISEIIADIVNIRGFRISIAEQSNLAKSICHDVLGYGPIEPLLARDDIGDIMVNGAGRIFIEVGGVIEETAIHFRDEAQLVSVCQRLAAKVGRHVDQSNPICDARMEDGSRVNIILPPLAVKGAALTIRKFKRDRLRLRDLVDFGSISPAGARVLAIIAACQCNVIISGGTGSGKTTLLNCLTAFINPRERIITCEDTAELQLQQPHVVSLETRPANLEGKGEITMRQLVRNCLRMRPERIIVGEVRGPEAFDLLQAMNTGHDGSMGTLHANSPRDALGRLEALVTMSSTNLPTHIVREMIVAAVDIVIQVTRLRDGSRRITHITEVLHTDGGTVITQDLLKFDINGADEKGKLIGQHAAAGISRPRFWDRAVYFGLEEKLADAMKDLGAKYTPEFVEVAG